MATNVRGHSSSRSQSSFFSGRSTPSGWGSSNSNTVKNQLTGSVGAAAGYKSCQTSFQDKVQSFKMLMNQTTGSAKWTRPSTTTLNSFANWINKGAVIQMCTPAQVMRWAKLTNKNFTSRTANPTSCKNVLCAKFGKSTIKAVARTKSGSFMVATSPVCKGKKFCFPK